MDKKTLVLLGLGGVLAYYIIQKIRGASEVLTRTGEAIGSGLYDFFNPDTFGETTMHIVRFPDGQKHSVPSRAVNSAGRFVNRNLSPNYSGDGKTYQLVTERATGAYVATLP